MLNLLNGVGVGLPYLSFVSMNVARDGLNFEALYQSILFGIVIPT